MDKLAVELGSGTVAGLAVILVGYPMETIKVRMQTQPSPPNNIYNGLADAVIKTAKWEGIRGFYTGVTAPLVMQLPFRTSIFLGNSAYLAYVARHGSFFPRADGKLSYIDYGIGGSLSWAAGTLLEAPINVASSQMQVEIVKQKSIPGYVPEFRNVIDFVARAPRKYGFLSLYTGFAPHILRNTISGFFHIGAFEASRREWAKHRGMDPSKIGLPATMVAGSIGGVLYWAVTYPLDVVKSALQGDSMTPGKKKYAGMADAFRKLYAEGGWRRFTRGFSACMARAIPANAVMLSTAFMLKEYGYEYLASREKAPELV
ncbi:mitochondrial carrier domain-containing protein [Hyaloraphidium curvatum]|nr:mitochondrial carrier domain-containing protein [Hyaloraphidium curvatum]